MTELERIACALERIADLLHDMKRKQTVEFPVPPEIPYESDVEAWKSGGGR